MVKFQQTPPKIWRARAFPYTTPSILTLKKSVKIKLTAVIPFLLRLLKWITGGTLYHGIVRSVTGCRERAILRNENSPYSFAGRGVENPGAPRPN